MYVMLNSRSSTHFVGTWLLVRSSETLEACEILGQVSKEHDESDKRFEG